MTKTIYFLQVLDSVVIGYHNYSIDVSNLSQNEKIVPINASNPDDYIGLNEEQIFMNPLPKSNIQTLDPIIDIKSKLKALYSEKNVLTKLGENTNEIENQINDLVIEYQFIKDKEKVTPLNF